MNNIRNIAVIAHIDHGKSTLVDRIMEVCGALPHVENPEIPRIDSMELEIEHGVTIKLKAIRLTYTPNPTLSYTLNIIDTPGHVDFSYEVSRALAAAEAAVLLVDATKGIQAQTLSNFQKAKDLGLKVIPVINKIDSPNALVDETTLELLELGFEEREILSISALKGTGVKELLETIVEKVPKAREASEKPFRALVFDSSYDEHFGVLAYVRVFDGSLKARDKVKFLKTSVPAEVKDLGFFVPKRTSSGRLLAGEVGFIATGLKDPRMVRVGDTITLEDISVEPLPGYREPQSYVFAVFYPGLNTDFAEFSDAIDKLRLEEPAIEVKEESSSAFGRGMRIGFLGPFHIEIVKERLKREYGLDLIVTHPDVPYKVVLASGEVLTVTSASQFPDASKFKQTLEPWVSSSILTPSRYLSNVIKLLESKRGIVLETTTFGDLLKVSCELPLAELMRGIYDSLKSSSSGFASLDWDFKGYRAADVVKLEIIVHGKQQRGFDELVLKEEAGKRGREKVKKLKDIIPKQVFPVVLQARVGGKILARETIPALRKDVTAPLYGGDVTRKRKLLEKQKQGKKRLGEFARGKGGIKIPPEAYQV